MVSDNLADSLVINRPSDAVSNSHSTECFTNRSILCDDSFTEQELDFICGIYKIVTGNVYFFAVNYLVKLTCLIIMMVHKILGAKWCALLTPEPCVHPQMYTQYTAMPDE